MTEAKLTELREGPPASPTSEPFWEATRRRQLVLQWCTSCNSAVFYPRDVCPSCLGSELEWRDASGRGSVHAVSVQHKPASPAFAARGPYAVALIELDEGPRMMSNVIGCEPDQVAVGMRVEISWEELADGRHLPQFTPSDDKEERS